MKVVHTLGWYFPESCGGTEVYVAGLTSELTKQGISNVIGAPLPGDSAQQYVHAQIEIFRYPFPRDLTTPQVRNTEPAPGLETFTAWLQDSRAELYHQHSWTSGCGIHHLRAAKALGMATVVTLHVPSNICLRGTMMLNGVDVCDGEIKRKRCGSCWGQARGMDRRLATALAAIPPAISRRATRVEHSRLATALSTSALVDAHKNHLQELSMLADRVVAVAEWQYNALVRNGVPESKLVLSRQGIDGSAPPPKDLSNSSLQAKQSKLRVGFFGRWDEVKGIHVIVQAVNKLPANIAIEVVVHALPPTSSDQSYRTKVLAMTNGNGRVRFADPVPHERMADVIQTFDVIAVPSQWLETGPLIVLEAQAAGVPVVGSNHGGIAEFVKDGIDGLLVPAREVEAWTAAFLTLATDRTVLARLRSGIGTVRTMADVASEMVQVYAGVIQGKNQQGRQAHEI